MLGYNYMKEISKNKQEIFSNIKQQIKFLHNLATKSGWKCSQPIIGLPASEEEILKVESVINLNLPEDLISLLKCSGYVEFSYIHTLKLPNEFRSLSAGAIYWNFDGYSTLYQSYKDWVDFALSDPEIFNYEDFEEQKELLNGKVPLLEVGNGDLIVVGYDPSEVIYFSHDWGELHGKRLGNTLFEFLQYYTRIGFVGPEDRSLQPFLINDSEKVAYDQDKITKWQKILGISDL